MKEKRKLWSSVKVRRDKMIGHLLPNDSRTKIVIEGDLDGYIERGRLRMKYTKQIIIDTGKDK